ncbi:shikimate dehydrogenase family protein [Marinobacterium aestuariivivens]|uniref:Shikimate dehydrogenase family protein n=1 Tax=Marinobacterium aestuariivivens TaxID=1698799 RepID=A0ABW2A7B3_9GAMM
MDNPGANTQNLCIQLNGATELIPIIGSPIAQVRSPAGMTQEMQAHGRNAVIVPCHVQPEDVDDFMTLAGKMINVSGVIATVPHKVRASEVCGRLTARAAMLGAANVIRRDADGSWYGDMCDGDAMVNPILASGCKLDGRTALLVGAGGAGIAIAHSLLLAGVAQLRICELDDKRFEILTQRLGDWAARIQRAETGDPDGCDLVVNASPCGMREGDPLPVDISRLESRMYVADVITRPEVTPLLQAAAELGCRTQGAR